MINRYEWRLEDMAIAADAIEAERDEAVELYESTSDKLAAREVSKAPAGGHRVPCLFLHKPRVWLVALRRLYICWVGLLLTVNTRNDHV